MQPMIEPRSGYMALRLLTSQRGLVTMEPL
jgi:hypothetical protein